MNRGDAIIKGTGPFLLTECVQSIGTLRAHSGPILDFVNQ